MRGRQDKKEVLLPLWGLRDYERLVRREGFGKAENCVTSGVAEISSTSIHHIIRNVLTKYLDLLEDKP
jgi:hypothetical protein